MDFCVIFIQYGIKYDEIEKKSVFFIKNPYFPIEKIQIIM